MVRELVVLIVNISKKPQQLGVTQSEIAGLMDDFNEYQGTTAIACAMSEVLDNQFNTADNTNDIMIGIIIILLFISPFFQNFVIQNILDFNPYFSYLRFTCLRFIECQCSRYRCWKPYVFNILFNVINYTIYDFTFLENVELISVSAAASIPAMANISTEPSNQFQGESFEMVYFQGIRTIYSFCRNL